MADLEFMFINKNPDSTSVSQSSAREKSAIGAYVYNRLKSNGSRGITNIPAGSSTEPRIDFTQIQAPELHPDNSKSAIDFQQSTTMLQTCGSLSDCCIVSIPPEAKLVLSRDASDEIRIPTVSHARELLQYYVQVYQPSTRFIEALLLPSDIFLSNVDDAFKHLQSLPVSNMEVNALFAAMSARIANIDGIPQYGSDLVYANRAFQAVSKRVEAGDVEHLRLFRTVSFLAVAAWHQKDEEAFDIHMAALKSIPGSAEDMMASGVVDIVAQMDGISAAQRLRRPVFPSAYFKDHLNAGQLSELAEQHTLSTIGQELQRCVRPFSRLLRDLILDLITIVRTLLAQSQEAFPSAPLVGACAKQLDLLRHRFVEIDVNEQAHERALQLAILIWMVVSLTDTATRSSVLSMTAILEHHLRSMGHQAWGQRPMLYFWILTVGAMASQYGSITRAHLLFELHRTALMSTELTVSSYVDLHNFSNQFLYFGRTQDPLLERLAEKLFN